MFLQNFIKYNEGNEIPQDYLLWCAYGALSLVIGRQVYLDHGGQFFIRPNLYCLLVGPSGDRKTSARDKIVNLMYEAIPDIIVSTECESHQGIIKYMDSPLRERTYTEPNGTICTYHPYGLFAPELMDYMAINPIGMVNFLTNIYDCSAEYRYRLRGGDQIIHKPYFVMCACTTGDWLTKQMNAETFSQGYGRRTILVTSPGFVRKKVYYLPEHEKARLACIDWLREMKTIVGPMIVEPAADKFFWDWYLGQKDPDDKFLAAWQSSKNVNLLKLATLNSVSERKDRVITINHMQMALELVNNVEQNLHKITDRLGRSELIEPTMAILDFIKARGGRVLEKELQMKMGKHFKSPMEQYQVMLSLKQTEQVEVVPVKDENSDVTRRWVCLPGTYKKELK